MQRFEFFPEGFAPEWSQRLRLMEPSRTRLALSDGVWFNLKIQSISRENHEKQWNFDRKWSFFRNFAEGFVLEWSQRLKIMEPSRTRRALSDALWIGSVTSISTSERDRFSMHKLVKSYFPKGFDSKWSQMFYVVRRDRSREKEHFSLFHKAIPSNLSKNLCKAQNHWYSTNLYDMIGWYVEPMKIFMTLSYHWRVIRVDE